MMDSPPPLPDAVLSQNALYLNSARTGRKAVAVAGACLCCVRTRRCWVLAAWALLHTLHPLPHPTTPQTARLHSNHTAITTKRGISLCGPRRPPPWLACVRAGVLHRGSGARGPLVGGKVAVGETSFAAALDQHRALLAATHAGEAHVAHEHAGAGGEGEDARSLAVGVHIASAALHAGAAEEGLNALGA
jgi:hypothetical protein